MVLPRGRPLADLRKKVIEHSDCQRAENLHSFAPRSDVLSLRLSRLQSRWCCGHSGPRRVTTMKSAAAVSISTCTKTKVD